MKKLIFIGCLFFLGNFSNAQIKPKIVYDTIRPSFWNNLKIVYSLHHHQRFKDRLIVKSKIDSSKLKCNVELDEIDPMLGFKHLNNLIELNDSQVLLIGRCKVNKIDYEIIDRAKKDPEHYKFKKKWLVRQSPYDSINRYRLFSDSFGKQYVKYSKFEEKYIMKKGFIKSCTVTSLNIWVDSKKEGKKKLRQHVFKTFVVSVGTLFLLEASTIGIYGLFFSVQ